MNERDRSADFVPGLRCLSPVGDHNWTVRVPECGVSVTGCCCRRSASVGPARKESVPPHQTLGDRRPSYRKRGSGTQRPVLRKLQLPTASVRTGPPSTANPTLKEPLPGSRSFDSRPDADVDARGERSSIRASKRWVTVPGGRPRPTVSPERRRRSLPTLRDKQKVLARSRGTQGQ